jgi:two-component system, NarL family, sensor histidine kinase DesK
MRLPWSLLVFAALAVAPVPVALQAGHPQQAGYFTLGVLIGAVPLAVAVWLIRAVRQLQAARSTLAQQAVVRERLRIDGELRQTVGAALRSMSRATTPPRWPPATPRRPRSSCIPCPRGTADAGQRTPDGRALPAGLPPQRAGGAASLLAAAGVQTRLVVASGDLPARLDQAAQATLRRDLARLLDRELARSMVTITVVRRTGDSRLSCAPIIPTRSPRG